MTQAERIARLAQPRHDPMDEPYLGPTVGTRNWLCADEVSLRALAAGVVTARLQQQARWAVRLIDLDET